MNFLLILFIYFVSFLDKPEKTAPQLSPRAIEQRQKWNIPTDQMDYPVSPMYMDSLRRMGVKIYHKSRWFNGVTCEMNETLAKKVGGLSFVTSVEMTRDDSPAIYGVQKRRMANGEWLTANSSGNWTDEQLALYNLPKLHEAGFEGQGILLAVCDGAFYNANTMKCFRQSQELGHFDFTDDGDSFYGSSGTHGSECLSLISGILSDEYGGYYGAATRSNYYLMRSEEMPKESPKEMDNLVVALETADSLGVNIFSASLGYAKFDNDEWTLDKENDLDGKTTRCSQAATIAARKGMLVCIAAGNEGNKDWRTISAPADADSILAVGAVGIDSVAGVFSSFGPSSDGRIKPEVCAIGVQATVVQPVGDMIITGNGTSFATPLLAGMAASLWSALPDENAMQIRERIIRSAHRYEHPDRQNHIGYGIPDAWKAYTMKRTEGLPLTDDGVEEKPQKILRDGQIIILRGESEYTVMGTKKR
ncbi:MAG: S8 family serine peptidase [Paludibacteraceae bacterium]|nr:S8 family serine peptidase [Paludibacteraceae bacterium]